MTSVHLFEIVNIFLEGLGLKINLSKGELQGIHVDDSEIDWLLSTFGCKQGHSHRPT